MASENERKPFWILTKQEIDEVAVISAEKYAIICTSLQTDNHASTALLNLYIPDAFTDAKQTRQKHKQQTQPIIILEKSSYINKYIPRSHR